VGSPVTGSYAFDSGVTSSSIVGTINPLTAFSLSFGTNPTVFTLADLDPVSIPPGRVIAFSTPGTDALAFFIRFPTISTFLGQTIVAQTLNLAPPQSYTAQITGQQDVFTFTFTATPAATPEPGALAWLGGATLCGCLARRRRLA
jgi:hypothetical protein